MDDEETYDGTAHKPDVIVAWLENKLIEGTDYTLSYSNNVNAGTAQVSKSNRLLLKFRPKTRL